jgi:hypothetical protein
MRINEILKEFAPTDHGDDDREDAPVPDELVVLANRWWNNTDDQERIAMVLRSMGWTISQVESEDDAVMLQNQNGTTHFISADEFDPDLF